MSCYWRDVVGERVKGIDWTSRLAWAGHGAFQVPTYFGDVHVELHTDNGVAWLERYDVFMRAESGDVPSSVRYYLPHCNPSVAEQRFRRRLARAQLRR